MLTVGLCVFIKLLRPSFGPAHIKSAILRKPTLPLYTDLRSPPDLWSRPCAARSYSLTSQLRAKPPQSTDGNESFPQPIKFSTSKASHRSWKVERSMGSRFQQPWWRVLPLSVFAMGFLLWCVFRQESDVDRALEKQLYEHLPGLLTNTEEREELAQEPDDSK